MQWMRLACAGGGATALDGSAAVGRPPLRRIGGVLAVCLAAALSQPGWALTYVPIEDGALFEQADAVVSGQVLTVDDGRAAVRYTVAVNEVLKGQLRAGVVQLRVAGAQGIGSGAFTAVVGAPRFAAGEDVLLFLVRRQDGSYAPVQLALGAFHARTDPALGVVFERDLSAAEPVGEADPEQSGAVRSADVFLEWLRDRARGVERPPDYWLFPPEQAQGPKYRLQGPPAMRWFEFDQGQDVTLYASNVGLIGLVGGGYSQVAAAVRAWNDDPYSNVRLAYSGLTSLIAALLNANRTNTVVFNDPYDDIPGVFNCTSGGVIATTAYHYSGSGEFRGATYARITEFDVVVQQNTACLLSQHGNANLEEVIAHEIGHGLGIGHSCGDSKSPACVKDSPADQALMRATAHMDGRGALLGSDDCAALLVLYPVVEAPSMAEACGGDWDSPGDGDDGGGVLPPQVLAVLLLAGLLQRRLRTRAGRSTGP